MALDLAENKYDIDFLEHLPGRCNVYADVLSRFYQPGKPRDVPPEIERAVRTWPVKRSLPWWETAGAPEECPGHTECNDPDEAIVVGTQEERSADDLAMAGPCWL